MELREKVARELEPGAWGAIGTGDTLAYRNRRVSSERKADRILSIPEIAAAMEAARHWSEGVELPRELIEKMACVYGSKPAMIRITDD